MNPSPIQDLAGNDLETTQEIQFQTAAPPSLPQNPFPEYAIWWSGSDRVGTIDPVNQQDRGDVFLGVESYPLGIPANVVPEFTDTVATEQNIPNFDPFEIVLDTRTNASTCHSWAYVQSFESGQVAIINTRTSVPVAMINTPSPGGITCSSGGGGPGVLVVTNSSVNTYTVFSIGGLTPGTSFLNGPLNIAARRNTGNNPRAVSISHPPGGDYRRGATGFPLLGPGTEVLMYADFSDGVVNTTTLARETPAKQFALGPQSAPNDLSFTSCNVLTGIMFAAISQGGSGPGQGKVAAYVAGPGCLTGVSTAGIPDEIVGDLSGLDGPSGLTFMSQNTSRATWAVAESGGDAVKTIGFAVGTVSPEIVLSHTVGVGDNPTAVTVRSAWLNPCIATQGTDGCTHGPVAERDCWYNGTEQDIVNFGLVGGTAGTNLYVCARGSGFVSVIEEGTGFTLDDPVMIPGIRFVATTMRQ